MPPPSADNRSSPRRKWLGLLARVLIVGTIFFFIGRSLLRNWNDLRQYEFSIRWHLIVLSYLVFGAYLVNRGLIWHWMTRKFGCAIPLRQALAAWFYSLPGKYVPGKVFLLVGRVHFYRRKQQSAVNVSMCFAMETIGILLASIFVLLIAPLFADVPLVARYRWPGVILLALLVVAIRPQHLELLANPLLRLAGRSPIALPLRYRDTVAMVAMFTANWTLLGLGFLLFINAIYPVHARYFMYLAGAFALSNTIGILALLAPAGLGVREAILVLALSPIMPHAIAIVVALAARLWMTVGELVTVGVVALVSQAEWREIHQGGRNADIGASKPESSSGGPSAMV